MKNKTNYPVSVNGRVFASMEFDEDQTENNVREVIESSDEFRRAINGRRVKKFVFVKGRIANFVTETLID